MRADTAVMHPVFADNLITHNGSLNSYFMIIQVKTYIIYCCVSISCVFDGHNKYTLNVFEMHIREVSAMGTTQFTVKKYFMSCWLAALEFS